MAAEKRWRSRPAGRPVRQRSPLVELAERGQLIVGQRKVQHVEILPHPDRVCGLRNDRDTALQQETQSDLRRGLAVPFSDGAEKRVSEDLMLALRERSPGLRGGTCLRHMPDERELRIEHMRLDLIHGGDKAAFGKKQVIPSPVKI